MMRKAKQLERVKRKSQLRNISVTSFSESEFSKFSQRYENGYDITTDERYNAWLRAYHPKSVTSDIRDDVGEAKCIYISPSCMPLYTCICGVIPIFHLTYTAQIIALV